MTAVALDDLIAREEALVCALDSGDVGAIECATQEMGIALSMVAATGGWRAEPELGQRLVRALRLAEAAGGRINYLVDDNRRRMDRLIALAGQPRVEAYGRSGRRA